MPLIHVAEMMVDRSLATRATGELAQLHREGLLKEWEEGFSVSMTRLPPGRLLGARQAAKLLQVLQERRKRRSADGVTVVEMMAFFDANSADLDENDQEFVASFFRQQQDFVQLKGFNRIHLIAQRLGRDFPAIQSINYMLTRHELAEAARIARAHLTMARAQKRRVERQPRRPKMVGNSGCGNDLSPVLQALGLLERAIVG